MTATEASPESVQRRPYLVGVLATLALLATAAGALLSAAAHDASQTNDGSLLAIALVCLAVGVLVSLRQPANPIGWLMLVVALTAPLTRGATLYVLFDFHLHHGALPAGRAAVFFGNAFWATPIFAVGPILLLFPDGTTGRRARFWLEVYGVLVAVALATQAVAAAWIASAPHLRVGATGNLVSGSHPFLLVEFFGSGLPVLLLFPFWAGCLVRLLRDLRSSSGDRRQQLKWFTAGAGVATVGLVVNVVSGGRRTTAFVVVNTVMLYGVVALPLGIGLGILRYRLYDIDRLISRTISYAAVTLVLVGAYGGVVLLATRVLPFSSSAGVAISTLAVAALFNPMRHRVQARVDRRFNRTRYDAERTVSQFAGTLRDAVDPAVVESGLLGVVERAFEPTAAILWLRPHAGGVRRAAPVGVARPEADQVRAR